MLRCVHLTHTMNESMNSYFLVCYETHILAGEKLLFFRKQLLLCEHKTKIFKIFMITFHYVIIRSLVFRDHFATYHISFKTEVLCVLRVDDILWKIKSIVACKCTGYLFFYFQMRAWCYGKKDKCDQKSFIITYHHNHCFMKGRVFK